jgi:WD40 repeat protein
MSTARIDKERQFEAQVRRELQRQRIVRKVLRIGILLLVVLVLVGLPSFLIGNKLLHPPTTNAVAFSPDGHLLAAGSADHTVRLWDVKTGTLVRTLSDKHMRAILSLAFSPDGRTLAVGSEGGGPNPCSDDCTYGVILWDVQNGNTVQSFLFGGVFAIAYSPNGRILAVSSLSIDLIGPDRTLQQEAATSLAFSPDGRTLAACNNYPAPTIILWDVARGKPVITFSGQQGALTSVAFSPDGHTLASGSADHTITLWDVRTGAQLWTLKGHTGAVYSVAFSPDGRTLASGSADHTIKLWNVQSGTVIRTLTGHTSGVRSVVFGPDGRTLASGSGDLTFEVWADQTVKLWDVKSGSQVRTLSDLWSVRLASQGRMGSCGFSLLSHIACVS